MIVRPPPLPLHHVQKRFQIEDIVAQSETGVVFRAIDAETGSTVALRRFFPFGAGGGGLNAEEQDAYRIAIGRLATVRHPALRAIVAGDCDKVDGMPFIVTEWVDGRQLSDTLAEAPLPAEHVAKLASHALEVSELLSHTLGEEAVWVETHPGSIVVSREGSGRDFTFWISPIRWLGNRHLEPPLAPLVTLTEAALHWQNRVVSDQAGRGMGGWLKWLRNTGHASLREAREHLAAMVHPPQTPAAQAPEETPAPTAPAPATATKSAPPTAYRPPVRLKQKSSHGIWWGIGALACVTAAAAWMVVQRAKPADTASETAASTATAPAPAAAAPAAPDVAKPSAPPPPQESKPPASSSEDERRRRIEAFNLANASQLQQETNLLAERRSAVDARGGVYFPTDEELLNTQVGSSVSLEGIVDRLEYSKTGKTLYLIFRENTGRTAPRGAVLLSKAPEVTESYLQPLIGRKLRIQGLLESNIAGKGIRRPEVRITGRSSIQQLE